MKIAIIDKFSGSNYGFSKPIVQHLKSQGHEVTVCNALTNRLGRHQLNNDFDVIHFDWADDLTAKGIQDIIKLSYSARVTVRLHAYELHDGLADRIDWSRVDNLILVSDHYQDLFKTAAAGFHRTPKRTTVVHHGIDLGRFTPVEHTGSDILYVGSINFKKGPQLLAQVAEAVKGSRTVHVYGDIQCHRSVSYLNNFNIRFNPHTKNIEDVMKDPRYEFILSTSLSESFHLAVGEGMACGLKPLVHRWYGADKLWPRTWATIEELKELINDTEYTSQDAIDWVSQRYNAKDQYPKLAEEILGNKMNNLQLVAACMISRNNFKGLKRALESCYKHIDAAYIAVDHRDKDNTVELATELLKELGLDGKVEQFNALNHEGEIADEDDSIHFSHARNIVHSMNSCNWAFVIDDDEFVINPEEIKLAIAGCEDMDAIGVTCGMGVDAYNNVSHTWQSFRLIKNSVRWKNPSHNIPDPTTIQRQAKWNGDLVVVDDKSIKPESRRTARSEQRHKNIDVFRDKINENPNDTRSMFYLAVAYREAAKYWEAIHWYKQYLNTGGWDEERWQACYDLACCQITLRRWTEARESLHQAVKEKSDRAEAFILMGDIFYKCQDFISAITWYELGCALPVPHNARLFVRKSVYDWERYDKLSMAYSHVGNWEAAMNCAAKVLAVRPDDERVVHNVKIWSQKYNGEKKEEVNLKA
jgi:tetratricopeptide (TPR) repeat protein